MPPFIELLFIELDFIELGFIELELLGFIELECIELDFIDELGEAAGFAVVVWAETASGARAAAAKPAAIRR